MTDGVDLPVEGSCVASASGIARRDSLGTMSRNSLLAGLLLRGRYWTSHSWSTMTIENPVPAASAVTATVPANGDSA